MHVIEKATEYSRPYGNFVSNSVSVALCSIQMCRRLNETGRIICFDRRMYYNSMLKTETQH